VLHALLPGVYCVSAAPHAGVRCGEQRTLLLANGKFQFETSRPSLLLTHIVLFTFHIMRTERDCRSTRKASDDRRISWRRGWAWRRRRPELASPTHAASERHARRYVEQARESGSREVPKPKLVLTVTATSARGSLPNVFSKVPSDRPMTG
jgi:hypothetical protein